MDILVIGGTRFVGRHFVEEALERGHRLTLFNRGNSSELFPGLEQLRGDRNADLSALATRRWDAVVDTCGYTPRPVRRSAEALANAVGRYLFISTVSVYADVREPFRDEDAPLAELADESTEEVTGESYGPLKVLCERAVREVFPDAHLIVRPGLVVGPHDPTDRFSYWPERMAAGGEVLAPEGPGVPVQFIDARDLAAFALRLLEQDASGVFNVVSSPDALTLGAVLSAAQLASGADAQVTWASAEFLLAEGVAPFTDLPLWIPGPEQNLSRLANARALAAGLALRPLEATVRDTLRWLREAPERERRAGLSREREGELLARWRARAGRGAGSEV